MQINRKQRTHSKHKRIRRKLQGIDTRPRLTVFKSNQHIYVQVIDDIKQTTIASSSTQDPTIKQAINNGKNCEAAKIVGESIGDKIIKLGITNIVFDRGGKLYHGRIKMLADAARSKGLQF
nr:ribosomal protein L18 [Erythrotrichia foliiformis]